MTESDTLPDITVRSQLIPLAGMKLLLPTTCIAEIVAWQTPAAVEAAPDWLLGTISWRGLAIPLLSFEVANGLPRGEVARGGRIAVMNGIGGDADLPFYALQVQGIPHLIPVEGAGIEARAEPDAAYPLVLDYAMLQGQEVVIPDQDGVEAMIKAAGLAVTSVASAE